MSLLLVFLALLLLPSPWNVVGALAAGALVVLETRFWHGRVRGLRVRTGAESLVGATGVAVDRLAPTGQVRVRGELWEARAPGEVPSGATVRVTAVDGLVLAVEASDDDVPPRPG